MQLMKQVLTASVLAFFAATQAYGEQRFTKDGDVVYDSLTGLSWYKKSADDGMYYNWYQASSYANGIGFRLPRQNELDSLRGEGWDSGLFGTTQCHWSANQGPDLSLPYPGALDDPTSAYVVCIDDSTVYTWYRRANYGKNTILVVRAARN